MLDVVLSLIAQESPLFWRYHTWPETDQTPVRVWTEAMGDYGQFDVLSAQQFCDLKSRCKDANIPIEQAGDED